MILCYILKKGKQLLYLEQFFASNDFGLILDNNIKLMFIQQGVLHLISTLAIFYTKKQSF